MSDAVSESNLAEKVSVIVVTAGRAGLLDSCLASIKGQTSPPREVIVIDNSLNSAFAAHIINTYKGIKLYSNPQNLYYCQSLNRGISISRGDFLLCLNDDVVLDKNFLRKALCGFGRSESIGMVSGKILRPDKTHLDSAGLFLTFWMTVRERGYGLENRGQFDKEGYIFGVNGAVAFLRRKMLEEIREGDDYFDSDFHIFYEDLDISWRAQRHGWRTYYVPDAIAYHTRGGTVRGKEGINKPFARRYLSSRLHADLIKNRYLTIIKNESMTGFILRLPAVFIYELASWAYVLIRRPGVIKNFFSQINVFKSAFKKRNMQAKKVSAAAKL